MLADWIKQYKNRVWSPATKTSMTKGISQATQFVRAVGQAGIHKGLRFLAVLWSILRGSIAAVFAIPSMIKGLVRYFFALPSVKLLMHSPLSVIVGLALLVAMVLMIDLVLLTNLRDITETNESFYRSLTVRPAALEEVPKTLKSLEESLNKLPLPVEKGQRKEMLHLLDQIHSVYLIQIDNRLHDVTRHNQEKIQQTNILINQQKQVQLEAQRLAGMGSLIIFVLLGLLGRSAFVLLKHEREERRDREIELMELRHIGGMVNWNYFPEKGTIAFHSHLLVLLGHGEVEERIIELPIAEYMEHYIHPEESTRLLAILEKATQPEYEGAIIRGKIRFLSGNFYEVRLLGAPEETSPLTGIIQSCVDEGVG